MSIIGIGIDLVENNRINKSIKNIKFINRIYSRDEILISKKIKDKGAYFSKRFAAKEAFVKSLGLGFRKGINFNDISILNDKFGKPILIINDKLDKIIKRIFKIKKFNFDISISDEKKYSVAFVIFHK